MSQNFKIQGITKSIQLCFKKFILVLLLCVVLVLSGCNPVITKFTPEKGKAGTVVTIEGDRFGDTVEENEVKFAGVPVPTVDIINASRTRLEVKVPGGAKTGLISVTTENRTGYSEKNFIFEPTPHKWTFLVYLDGDNNLESAAVGDFLEMAEVGSSDQVNIVVQMDRHPRSDMPFYTDAYGNWAGTRRFLIKKNDTPAVPPVQDLGEKNMGDPNVLRNFVEWGVNTYPAEHYILVIWNHGDGWRLQKQKLMKRVRTARSRSEIDWGVTRIVASDDTDGDELYMKEVQQALEGAKKNLNKRSTTFVKLDIVGFDACLMGMVEVAYALRDSANYVIGSEDEEPLQGWPYDRILRMLTATPIFSPKDLCGIIVNMYLMSYPNGNEITQSAVDISRLSKLVEAINKFHDTANSEWDKLKDARKRTIEFRCRCCPTICWGVDLWDFADNVFNKVTSADIKEAASDLKNAINDFVIMEAHSPDMVGAHGIAIYFPPNRTTFNEDPEHAGYEEDNQYMQVDFVINALWDNWLRKFYANIP